MSIFKNKLLSLVLLLYPILSWADEYPVNKNIDIKHYSFQVAFSDANDQLDGIANITVLFKKAGENSFRLDLINQTAEREGKGMLVRSIKVGDKAIEYSHENDALIIQLPKASELNQELIFTISYHGIPADGMRIGPTRFGDRSFMNENWPNRARHWLPTLDHISDKATSEFIVTAPADYKVISNGLLQEESDLGNNMRLTHWKQSVPVSPWLFTLGIADFAVKFVDNFEGKSIQSWVFAKNREAGFYDFDEPTKAVLEYYSNYVGPFAYEKLANVQSASVGGGMETSSAIFYGENLINGQRTERLRNVVIHELAHQWFGNAVTESTWDDAWLSEGITTYFTLMFIEHQYGQAEFQRGLANAKKTVFTLAEKFPDFSIVAPRTAEKEAVVNGLTYQKGAWVMHMLRDFIGEENFKKGIRAYYTKFFNANASTTDLRLAMEEASGKDLKTFFQQWLYQPINLELSGSWEYDANEKAIKINLIQVQSEAITYEMPVEIAYYTKGSSDLQVLNLDLKERSLNQSFKVDVAPDKLVIDPRNVLLWKGTFDKKYTK